MHENELFLQMIFGGIIPKTIVRQKSTTEAPYCPAQFFHASVRSFIHLPDILRFSENGESHRKLNETNLIRDIIHINDSYPADKLFIQMRAKEIHIAAVKNQDQELLGIVTLTDIIGFLVNHR